MTSPVDDWVERVQRAAIAGDADALRELFLRGKEIFGDEASVRWADAMSGLDASAQTG